MADGDDNDDDADHDDDDEDDDLVVNFLVFWPWLVQDLSDLGETWTLVGFFPMSLPQLSKQLRDHHNNPKPMKNTKIEI